MRLWAKALVIALLGNVSCFAQSPEKQPVYKITGISIEGTRFADKISIISTSGLYIGETIAKSDEKISSAIRRLSERGLFSSVDIIATAVEGSNVTLVIRVKDYPRLEQYKITGNDNESESDLKKKIILEKRGRCYRSSYF